MWDLNLLFLLMMEQANPSAGCPACHRDMHHSPSDCIEIRRAVRRTIRIPARNYFPTMMEAQMEQALSIIAALKRLERESPVALRELTNRCRDSEYRMESGAIKLLAARGLASPAGVPKVEVVDVALKHVTGHDMDMQVR